MSDSKTAADLLTISARDRKIARQCADRWIGPLFSGGEIVGEVAVTGDDGLEGLVELMAFGMALARREGRHEVECIPNEDLAARLRQIVPRDDDNGDAIEILEEVARRLDPPSYRP